jgi:hypothetical protein
MRYRVEVDQTLTYQVEVDAESVEEAIADAEQIISEGCDCPGGTASHYPVTGDFVQAGDAVEVPDDSAA